MFKDPGRLAWTVLLIGLVLFCITTFTIYIGVRWFLFDSTVPLNTTLYVSRNTASVLTSTSDAFLAVHNMLSISPDTQITTDSSSQGQLTFTDPYTHQAVASITLLRDSSVQILSFLRPRFEFSGNAYVITAQFQGSIDVDVFPDLDRDIIIDVESGHGLIRMGKSGRYLLTNQTERFSVLNRAGEAVLINNAQEARAIPEGLTGWINTNTNTLEIAQPLVDIIPDGSFDTFNPADPAFSSEWGCYSLRDDVQAAEGEYRREVINGRAVMHITRVEEPGKPATNHAETGCLQYLNTITEPLPVTVFDYLELRVTLQIRDRPLMLSMCGQQGSECPVMVVIEYLNQYKQPQQWIHGFFTRYDQAVGWPLRCATCAQDHEQLNQDTWYTYTSGNLLQLLPEDQKPVAISSVRFYASGHEYEVLLGEVALLAGDLPQQALPNETATSESS
ncbi:MAG: hypothetical protein JXN59_00395 [Anaerolineae bacterium]|nr:hypothetical protein [Anaerolineae bacterium]